MTPDNPNHPDQQHIWHRVLDQLKLQMTQATFDTWLKETMLISVDADNVYVIAVQNSFAKDWLENRLFNTIQRTLADIIGTAVSLKFVEGTPEDAAGFDSTMPPTPVVTPDDLPLDLRLSDAKAMRFVESVDFEHLWLKTGFTQVPDYAIRYWRTYLGRAFDLWEFLLSEDKRDVKKMLQKKLPYWTPTKRYSYRGLASVLGCGRPTLTGRLAPCWIYERQKKEARESEEPLPEASCCGKYYPRQMRPNGQSEMECVHWLEGILERLYREGLVAVQRFKHHGKPRAHELRLQAWRLVPVLTPFQVAQFRYELDRERHKSWIQMYGHLCNFDLVTWEQMMAESLVIYVPGYEWGRELFDVYQNNPLLGDGME
jgi:hypothetical protein